MGSHFRVRLEVRLLGDQMNKICFGPVSEHRLQREGWVPRIIADEDVVVSRGH